MSEVFDPYYRWLGISPKDQPPNHYRLLAIELFESQPDVIEHAADRQMAHLRTLQTGSHGGLSQKLLNEVALAKLCLLNQAKKAAYDAQLQSELARSQPVEEPQESSAVQLDFDVSPRRSVVSPPPPVVDRTPQWLIVCGIAVAAIALGLVLVVALRGGKKAQVAQARPAQPELASVRASEPKAAPPSVPVEPPPSVSGAAPSVAAKAAAAPQPAESPELAAAQLPASAPPERAGPVAEPKPDAAVRLAHEGQLSEDQRLYRDWSDATFRDAVNPARWQALSATESTAAEARALEQLSGRDAPQRYEAITALATLGSRTAVPELLKIATAEKEDGRARWMSVRALGLIGDARAVPQLAHMTYHPHANARCWAQIALVRLTGQNFGRDLAAWKAWWEKQGGKPPISTEPIVWTTNAEQGDPQKQIESDRQRLESLRKQRIPAGVICDPVTGVCLPTVPQASSSASFGAKSTSKNKSNSRGTGSAAEHLDGGVVEFNLIDAYGREVRASDYRGSPLLILLGACWCGGCQQDAEVLRGVEQKYRARGLQTIRCTVWDHELPAWEFQKHYRLPSVPLQDPIRQFERRYNRGGWTFLMLVDAAGRIVDRATGVVDWAKTERQIEGLLAQHSPARTIERDGIAYLPAVLERSGEIAKLRQRDTYPSLACAGDGRVYLAFTSNRNGSQDVFLRVFDGQQWSPDQPIAATRAEEFDGAVMVDRKNRAWVSWTSNAGGPHYDIYVTGLARGSAAPRPIKVTNSADDAMHARMAADSAGRVWVTYYKWAKLHGRSRDKEVYVRALQSERWSNEIHVSPDDIPDYEDHTDPVLVAQGNGLICAWSWDFHRPQNYTQVPQMPTIFLRKIGPAGPLGRARAVSGPNADTRPTLAVARDGRVWCAWESAGGPQTLEKQISFSIEDLDRPENPGAGVSVSGPQQNVCTPCLALSPQDQGALVWSEADRQNRWTLKLAAWDAQRGAWGSPRTLVAVGNPRFPSAAYDPSGALWVAYSVDKGDRREIEVLTEPAASAKPAAAAPLGKPR